MGRVLAPFPAVLALALPSPACRPRQGEGSPSLQTRLGEWVRLAPGQSLRLPREGLTLRFLEVPHDSRCPIGARCVWAGVARIRLTFNLEPHPEYPRAITPQQYRLRLRVERKEAYDG